MKKSWSILLLAGGKSSRTSIPKQLFMVEQKPLICWQIEKCLQYQPANVYVVLGANYSLIRGYLNPYPVKVIENSNWNRGMISSVKIGLNHIRENQTFIHPVDVPLPNQSVFTKLLGYQCALPTYQGKKGHPVLISKRYYQDLINSAQRLDHWINQSRAFQLVDTNDPDILLNLNTDREFEQWQNR
ncbi:MAG: nucleotidyltransferase family protein [bacterium]